VRLKADEENVCEEKAEREMARMDNQVTLTPAMIFIYIMKPDPEKLREERRSPSEEKLGLHSYL